MEELRADSRNIRIVNLRRSAISRPWQRFLQACSFAILMADNFRKGQADWCVRPIFDLLFRDDAPIAALLRYIKTAQPGAILSLLNYPNAALLIAGRVSPPKTRMVVSVHNTISASTGKSDSRRSRDVPRLMKRLFPLANEIIAPSTGVAEDVAAVAGIRRDRISMIYNPVFGPSLLKQAAAEIDDPWLADSNIPVIVAAGKLKLQKDFPTLLRAFGRIRRVLPSRLIILGEGPERASLLELAEELGVAADVALPGQVRNPYVYYRRAACFVLSSEWEGLPTVLIEAMACGCPVVSTACPSGPSEILEEGRFGYLVPVGDDGQLAKAVLDTLAQPPPREHLIERARCFSIDEAAMRYERLMLGTPTVITRAVCGGERGEAVQLQNSNL